MSLSVTTYGPTYFYSYESLNSAKGNPARIQIGVAGLPGMETNAARYRRSCKRISEMKTVINFAVLLLLLFFQWQKMYPVSNFFLIPFPIQCK